MTALLEIENVCKWVGTGDSRTDILKNVSLSIAPGEFVSITGASGSGKSTLMNLMGLLDTPSTGSVRFLGQETVGLSEDALAALRAKTVGFIFQAFHLLPYLTVRDNVALGLAYRLKAALPGRIDEMLKRVQLSHRAGAYPSTLSGGERQRVAIARALAHQPALLLADEPTGSLDSASGVQVMDFFTEFHREGTTLVLITHDESIAKRAARRYLMRDGHLV